MSLRFISVTNKQSPLPIILIATALFFCLASAEGTPNTELQTGIEGVISSSPIHGGPSRVGVPDSCGLANTAFVVKEDERTITSFQTDNEGHFQVSLKPGHYTISKKDWKGGIGYYGPFEVDVTAGNVTKVRWTCDTGMR